ncbi:MAG: hypothetical protein IJJ82_06315 [Clostridia bacterium]|nr:hypothetical protein [Clostridia bacterium]
MSENIYWGMNEELRKYANDKNREIAAKEAEKQTRIIEQAERQKIQAMYDIAKKQDLAREQEKIEYNYRRNQQIFDNIGFSYDVVGTIYMSLAYMEKKFSILDELKDENKDLLDIKLESKENKDFIESDGGYDKYEKFKNEFEEEYKNNDIISKYNSSQVELFGIMNKVEKNKKRMKLAQLLVIITLFFLNSGFIGIGLFCSYLIIMLLLEVNWIRLNSKENKQSEINRSYSDEYGELYDTYLNNKISSLKSRYENLLEDFQEFRKNNYNKDVETALDLIGIIDKNILDESIGTKEAYKRYFNEFSEKIKNLEYEAEEIPLF